MNTFDQPLARWIIEQALNGNMFYLAVSMITAAAAMRIATSWRGMYGWRTWAQLLFWIGLALLFVAGGSLTLPWFGYLALLGTAAAVPRQRRRLRRMLLIPTGAMLALCLAFTLSYEMGWRWTSRGRVPVADATPIVVFGDSLSASLTRDAESWPRELEQRMNRPVVNLASIGGVIATAHRILDEQPVRDSIAIVMLGGNDLLGGTLPPEYAAGVARLIQRLQQAGNQVVWVECPAPPNAPWYGWIQHWVAHRHGVRIVPKRVPAAVLFGQSETTIDGLHLAATGQQAMARRLEPWLRQWFVFTPME